MKIGVLALLQNLDPGYSVATVVKNHLKTIKHYGHEPVLITSSDSSIKPEDVFGAEVRAVLPVWQFHDYALNENVRPADQEHIQHARLAIQEAVKDVDRIIEHDCVLQGWFYPYGIALNSIDNVAHVIHSVPGNQPLRELNPTHRILVLNENMIGRTKEAYGTDRITAIPNYIDIRDYLGFHDITKRMIKDWNLLDYDYIFTYPLSATRWHAKGVPFLAEFTKYMWNQGYKVCLVLLLAHAKGLPLSFDHCHHSNAEYEEYKDGVPREVVRDFMLLSDGFFLASTSELSPLVHMEAALAKNPVYINRMLKLTTEAETIDMTQQYNWHFEIILRDFFKETKYLNEFRRVRKDMNADVIGKKLIDWMIYA